MDKFRQKVRNNAISVSISKVDDDDRVAIRKDELSRVITKAYNDGIEDCVDFILHDITQGIKHFTRNGNDSEAHLLKEAKNATLTPPIS